MVSNYFTIEVKSKEARRKNTKLFYLKPEMVRFYWIGVDTFCPNDDKDIKFLYIFESLVHYLIFCKLFFEKYLSKQDINHVILRLVVM